MKKKINKARKSFYFFIKRFNNIFNIANLLINNLLLYFTNIFNT